MTSHKKPNNKFECNFNVKYQEEEFHIDKVWKDPKTKLPVWYEGVTRRNGSLFRRIFEVYQIKQLLEKEK